MTENVSITIKQLNDISIKTIHTAFVKAFADYSIPFNISIQGLTYMLERRGCDLSLSFGAFDNDELVGFILNGIGYWNDKLTAYDTGTGLIQKYRRQGIATRIFNESMPVLRQNNISHYLLEVIQSNRSAYELYRKAGFEVEREFDCYVSSKNDIKIRDKVLNSNFTMRIIEKPDWDLLSSFWDFVPSWQNSIDSVNRKIEQCTVLGVFDDAALIGYGIIENHTGDIPQIGVEKSYRHNGLATTLLKHLLDYSESDKVRIINIDADDEPFKNFTKSMNLTPSIKQYEMILQI